VEDLRHLLNRSTYPHVSGRYEAKRAWKTVIFRHCGQTLKRLEYTVHSIVRVLAPVVVPLVVPVSRYRHGAE